MILPNRKSIRKKEYNYAQPGYYHATICCYNHQPIFGYINHETMVLNEFGLIAQEIWREIENRYKNVHIYALQIMPNHMHVIIQLIDTNINIYTFIKNKTESFIEANLSEVIGAYKSITTNRIYQLKKENYVYRDKFEQLTNSDKIWQRNFYEQIIKDDIALKNITAYILENPKRWGNKK